MNCTRPLSDWDFIELGVHPIEYMLVCSELLVYRQLSVKEKVSFKIPVERLGSGRVKKSNPAFMRGRKHKI